MQEWVQKIVGDTVNPIVAYVIIFLLIVLAIYILVRIARRLLGGTFVAGGKSRHLRLAIMDAAPVDSHRRLVLVRRDDVEHLILIGGPTDVVVEQNIRHSVQQQPRLEPVVAPEPPSIPGPTRTETPPPPAPIRQPQPVQPPQPAPRPYTPPPIAPRPMQPAPLAPVRPLTPVQPVIEPRPMPTPSVSLERLIPAFAPKIATTVVAAATTVASTAPSLAKPESIEDAMLADLSNDIDNATKSDADDISLEDEMEGILANLDTKNDRIG